MLLVTAVYAAGLSRALTQPWVGMHDWNGAFFSQLARNFLRYPMSLHHGVPIVAVGQSVPPAAERSIYATHPPGLVWVVAGAFKLLGEAEWVARGVPIAASLGTLWLLIVLIDRGIGRRTALVAGLTYSVLPMSVYFGRMVDHEAVCLFCMLAALWAWHFIRRRDLAGPARHGAWAAWITATTCVIWVDWSGVLFAGVFCGYAWIERRRGKVGSRAFAFICAVSILAIAGMVTYLVYAGLAGRWSDLFEIYQSRATNGPVEPGLATNVLRYKPWTYTLENLTWPVAALFIIGMCVRLFSRRANSGSAAGDAEGGTDNGLWTVLVTALLWVCLLWRQYERHNYWLFYLGPAAAMYTAVAIIRVQALVGATRRRGGRPAMYAAAALVILFGLRGIDAYYERTAYPPDAVIAWRHIHDEETRPGDRLLLFRDPVRDEQRGEYHLRNIVPPQIAFYLDRAFDAEPDLQRVLADVDHAVFVIPVTDAVGLGGRLAPLKRRFPNRQVGNQVVFKLKERRPERPIGRTVPSEGGKRRNPFPVQK